MVSMTCLNCSARSGCLWEMCVSDIWTIFHASSSWNEYPLTRSETRLSFTLCIHVSSSMKKNNTGPTITKIVQKLHSKKIIKLFTAFFILVVVIVVVRNWLLAEIGNDKCWFRGYVKKKGLKEFVSFEISKKITFVFNVSLLFLTGSSRKCYM